MPDKYCDMKKIFLSIFVVFISMLTGCSLQESIITEETDFIDAIVDFDLNDDKSSGFIVEGNSLTLEGEDITLTFEDEFEVNDQSVEFGPKGITPESPTDKPYETLYYSLSLANKRSVNEIRREIDELDQDRVSLKPVEIEIGDLKGLKWAVGGMCEERIMELLGRNNNIRFYSSGCHTPLRDTDFEYFERLFK